MEELEANVRAIEMDGLVWGASKLVPSAFKINKLQINIVVEDDKVSTDELQAQIEEDEDHVQSTDVVSDSRFSQSGSIMILTAFFFPGCYAEALIGLKCRVMKNGMMMDTF